MLRPQAVQCDFLFCDEVVRIWSRNSRYDYTVTREEAEDDGWWLGSLNYKGGGDWCPVHTEYKGPSVCPTECDPGCLADCHELHQVSTKRFHEYWDCPGVAEGNRDRALKEVMHGEWHKDEQRYADGCKSDDPNH